jgi:hypothetical protein
MHFDIRKAEYLGEYNIRIDFEDGSTGVADLSDYPDENTVFRPFRDLSYFMKFRVEYGTIVWGEGELDIAPETLYERATGKPVMYESTHLVEM